MSEAKTREDVELARIKADLEKTTIVFDSVLMIVSGLVNSA